MLGWFLLVCGVCVCVCAFMLGAPFWGFGGFGFGGFKLWMFSFAKYKLVGEGGAARGGRAGLVHKKRGRFEMDLIGSKNMRGVATYSGTSQVQTGP